MQKGMFIALAALALAVFAVPQAQGKSGPDVDQRLVGSTFVIDTDEETGDVTARQNALAKGQPGKAQVTSQLVFGAVAPDARCPADFPFGGDLISFDFVETYNDGSLLTGSASPGQAVCSDGATFVVDVTGVITGAAGRFAGATGTWQAAASTPGGNNSLTGTFTADLD